MTLMKFPGVALKHNAFTTKGLFDELMDTRFFENTENNWRPAANVSESPNAYLIELAIPGIDKDAVKIEVEHKQILVTGERKNEKQTEETNYSRREFSYGSFERSFRMPDTVDHDKISAEFKNGMLSITLPKREEVKPRPVKIVNVD